MRAGEGARTHRGRRCRHPSCRATEPDQPKRAKQRQQPTRRGEALFGGSVKEEEKESEARRRKRTSGTKVEQGELLEGRGNCKPAVHPSQADPHVWEAAARKGSRSGRQISSPGH